MTTPEQNVLKSYEERVVLLRELIATNPTGYVVKTVGGTGYVTNVQHYAITGRHMWAYSGHADLAHRFGDVIDAQDIADEITDATGRPFEVIGLMDALYMAEAEAVKAYNDWEIIAEVE